MTRTPSPSTMEAIYAVPIGTRWLLAAPHSGNYALVNRAAVAAVATCAVGRPDDTPESIRHLWGQLSATSDPACPPPPVEEKLVIIPTRACNMQCIYCDFVASEKRAATLDPRVACKFVDDAIARATTGDQDTLRIHFFGGEPLVARRCVETIVHYTRMACARRGLTPWFEVTTNGLLDRTAVPFIGDYMDSAVISLDGAVATHDFNRRRLDGRGTYSAIAANIRRLSKFPVELSLRACITDRSVDDIPAIAAHFCAEFEFDILSFEMLAPNESAHSAGLSPPDPRRFAAGVLQAESVAAAHGVRVVHGPSELTGPRTTSCPLGRGTRMLNPEGQLTACYLEPMRWQKRELDLVIGQVDSTSGVRVDSRKLDAIVRLVESKPRCARCFCRHTCAGGCHVDQTPPGCSVEYDDRCRATRVITAGRILRNLEGSKAAEEFARQPAWLHAVAESADDRLATWTSEASRRPA